MRKQKRHSDDGVIGCLIWVIIILIALPVYGVYRIITGKSDGEKAVGVLLLIVGILLWIVVGTSH